VSANSTGRCQHIRILRQEACQSSDRISIDEVQGGGWWTFYGAARTHL